jgi:hypothetical protein
MNKKEYSNPPIFIHKSVKYYVGLDKEKAKKEPDG